MDSCGLRLGAEPDTTLHSEPHPRRVPGGNFLVVPCPPHTGYPFELNAKWVHSRGTTLTATYYWAHGPERTASIAQYDAVKVLVMYTVRPDNLALRRMKRWPAGVEK